MKELGGEVKRKRTIKRILINEINELLKNATGDPATLQLLQYPTGIDYIDSDEDFEGVEEVVITETETKLRAENTYLTEEISLLYQLRSNALPKVPLRQGRTAAPGTFDRAVGEAADTVPATGTSTKHPVDTGKSYMGHADQSIVGLIIA